MYIPTENQLGIQPIAIASAVKNHDLGTIVRARDQVYGQGEFIYLLGTFGTVIGSLVIWEGQSQGNPTYQTQLAPATQFLGQPLAVAMSNAGAGQYGWYQIGGQAVCATNGTVAGNVPVYLAGSGQVTTTQANGMQIQDAVSVTASGVPSSGLAVVEIDRPFAQGQETITTQRSIISSSGLPIQSKDFILNLNVTAPLAITIPAANTRGGIPLIFEDVGGTWATNNVTFSRTGTDTFDGATSVVASVNYGWIEFTPMNDGVNAGYKLQGIYQ